MRGTFCGSVHLWRSVMISRNRRPGGKHKALARNSLSDRLDTSVQLWRETALATAPTRLHSYLARQRHSYRPRRPRNDPLLRTTLALQQLAHVTTRCYELATTTRPYQRNVQNRDIDLPANNFGFPQRLDLSCPRRLSNCIPRLDRSQLTSIKHLAVSPRLDLRQLPSSNVRLRTTTTTTRPYQLTT